jgi:type I restriction enzyme, S subunit
MGSSASPKWRTVKLRDVCRIAGGYGFPLRHQGLAGTIPFFKVSDMNRRGNEVWLSESENYDPCGG